MVANLESKKKISGDALLYAVGRQGNVDELNLAAAGIEADNRGRIPVDADYRTKQPHIYAVGDVIGFPSLASVSMEQGRIAAAHAFDDKTIHSNPAIYPYGIYTIPEISFIGKTEEQLTEEDVPYEVGVAYYREIARGQIRGDTTGRLKMIFHRETRQVLGVHIIGEGAAELLHIGQAVMILGGTVDYFVDTVFNYPTLAECYKAAAFNGLEQAWPVRGDAVDGEPLARQEEAMRRTIGVTMAEHVVAGVVENHKLVRRCDAVPEDSDDTGRADRVLPADALLRRSSASRSCAVGTAGERSRRSASAFPGIIRDGVIEESPNLQQLKGCTCERAGARALTDAASTCRSRVQRRRCVAAGIAATRGQLDRLIRVWTLGNGIGFGRYPVRRGRVGGRPQVVSLDQGEVSAAAADAATWKASWAIARCACASSNGAGRGFRERPKKGDQRCIDFVRAVASRAGGGDGHARSTWRARASSTSPATTRRPRSARCSTVSARDGEDEPAAELLGGGSAGRSNCRHHRRRGGCRAYLHELNLVRCSTAPTAGTLDFELLRSSQEHSLNLTARTTARNRNRETDRLVRLRIAFPQPYARLDRCS